MKPGLRRLLITLLLIFPVIFVSLTYIEDLAETGGEVGAAGVVSLVTNLPRQALNLVSEAGYVGIFVLMLAEAAAFPIPSEIILPFAGYLVYAGTLEFWPTIIITTVAAIIGSYVDYFLGLKLGEHLLMNHGRVVFLKEKHLRQAEVWFNHYGPIAVALFRLVPGARVLISFPAGLYRMGKLRFGIYTLAGCLPWNIILIYLGWWLGSSWASVVETFRYINLFAYSLVMLFVAWVAWRLLPTRNRHHRE